MASARFALGTVQIKGLPEGDRGVLRWDRRIHGHRVPAYQFSEVPDAPALDAPAFDEVGHLAQVHVKPRDYQREALAAFFAAGGRGVVELPTGSGKSLVGLLAIEQCRRRALVVAPTLDLVWQWHGLMSATFAAPIGVLGGGEHDVQDLTVATYDSAALYMERYGDRFGLLVFDEVHHLPTPRTRLCAEMSLAPHRLGLSATVDRLDGAHDELDDLIGPRVYERGIVNLRGEVLSPYQVNTLEVELSEADRARYDEERGIYLDFLRQNRIFMGGKNGWGNFIRQAARSNEGRRAMLAHRRQKRLAQAAPEKIRLCAELLFQHRHDKCLIFTDDNRTAYDISRRCLVPAITHQTKVKERTAILGMLKDGTVGAVVTSRVLNEGVDVPAANVAIVVSGTSTVREHVQRLGRVLRKQEDKLATFYEIIAADTTETAANQRRREHDAYR